MNTELADNGPAAEDALYQDERTVDPKRGWHVSLSVPGTGSGTGTWYLVSDTRYSIYPGSLDVVSVYHAVNAKFIFQYAI